MRGKRRYLEGAEGKTSRKEKAGSKMGHFAVAFLTCHLWRQRGRCGHCDDCRFCGDHGGCLVAVEGVTALRPANMINSTLQGEPITAASAPSTTLTSPSQRLPTSPTARPLITVHPQHPPPPPPSVLPLYSCAKQLLPRTRCVTATQCMAMDHSYSDS